VIGVSVGMALGLAILDHTFLAPYNGVIGQLVLVIVVAIYAAGVLWLRRLAKFEVPERLLTSAVQLPGEIISAGPGGPA